jgi:hypothetical protein
MKNMATWMHAEFLAGPLRSNEAQVPLAAFSGAAFVYARRAAAAWRARLRISCRGRDADKLRVVIIYHLTTRGTLWQRRESS